MLAESKIVFGLTERDIDTISSIFKKYSAVTEVYIFGSRAKDTQKAGSDIDMAIMNEGVNAQTMLHIKADFEDSTLPYTVDLINYPTLTNPDLISHIQRVGKLLYQAESPV